VPENKKEEETTKSHAREEFDPKVVIISKSPEPSEFSYQKHQPYSE
jgi:hypothetical protein